MTLLLLTLVLGYETIASKHCGKNVTFEYIEIFQASNTGSFEALPRPIAY